MGKVSPRVSSAVADMDYDDEEPMTRAPMRTTEHRARASETRPEPISDPEPINEQYVYERPNQMKAPPPQPGYVQRWVRMETRGVADPTNNYQMKMLEGYAPRHPETLPPEYRILRAASEGIDSIRMGSLVLCEKPIHKANAKIKWLAEQVNKQNQMVQAEHQKISQEGQRQTGIPLVHEETESVSRGRRPATMVS
jgi:hypothetical protein